MPITIPGLSISDIETADTKPKAAGGTFFPATEHGYTRFTGVIESAEIKTIVDDEFLSFQVVNGTCKQEILVSIEPAKTNPNSKVDPEKQVQNNLDTLRAAVKLSGCYDAKGALEPKNLKPGRLVAFDAKITGWRDYNGARYPKIRAYFRGEASDLVPVTPLELGRPAAAPAAAADDLPF